MKALILGGGGARGAYEAGVAMALVREERFDIVCGVSVGAINGAFIAQDDAAELERIWRSMASLRVIRLAPEVESLTKMAAGLRRLSHDPIAQRAGALLDLAREYAALSSGRELTTLQGALLTQPIADILAPRLKLGWLKHTLIVNATNLNRGRSEPFYHFAGLNAAEFERIFRAREPHARALTDETYLSAICASSAIPGAFQPVAIKDDEGIEDRFVDGAITGNAPIRQAIDAGATEVTVIHMDRADLRPREQHPASIADVAITIQDIRHQHMLELDLKLAASVNKAVLAGTAPGKRYVQMRVITPQAPLAISIMGFDDQAAIDDALEHGQRDGERYAVRAG
jgi:NTE family protein